MAILDSVLASETNTRLAMATLDGVVAVEKNTHRAMATLDSVLATEKNTHRAMATLDGVLATDSEEHSQRYGDTRWRAGYRQWRTLTALWRHSMACWLQTVKNTYRAMATLGGVLAKDSEVHLPRYGDTRWRAGYRQWLFTALWRHSMACWLQTVKNTYRAMATLDGVLTTDSEEHLPRYGDTRWRAGYRQWLFIALWRHSVACWLQTVKYTYRAMATLGGVLATDSEEHLPRYGDTRWRAGYRQWRTLTALWRHSMACWLQTVKNTYCAMATLGGVLTTDSEEHLPRYGDTRWRAGYRQWRTLTALWRHSVACWLQTVMNTYRAMATLDGVLATDSDEHLPLYGDTRWRADCQIKQRRTVWRMTHLNHNDVPLQSETCNIMLFTSKTYVFLLSVTLYDIIRIIIRRYSLIYIYLLTCPTHQLSSISKSHINIVPSE